MRIRQSRPLTWRRVALGLSAFLLFALALGLLKEGASGLTPLIRHHLEVNSAADGFGFGWLMACLVLSGSPVAAVAVALLAADALSPVETFAMVAGSRLGASFSVLLIGFLYVLRGHDRWSACSAGVLSLLLTGSMQFVAVPMGLFVLRQGWLDNLSSPWVERLAVGFSRGLDPVINRLTALLPNWGLFIAGVGLVTLSFRLFDRALPQVRLEKTDFGQVSRLVYRPEVMFLMGLVITLVTMSVSVSVGILVPLSARGYMRRENIVPYILGANITTLVDTFVAGLLLGDSRAMTVVATHMACVILVSLPVILVAFRPYERAISSALAWITRGRANFAFFLSVIFVVPVALILL